MKKILLVAHGNFALAAKESIEMIMGTQNQVIAVSFHMNEGLRTITEKLQHEIDVEAETEWLVITDLFGGTPFNACSSIAMTNPQKTVRVLSGLSLPMLLEIVLCLEEKSLDELVSNAIVTANYFVKEFVRQEEEESI
ncbi:PTS sugar transporter subunit IIA [Listeria booriae]|uniref:PTS mannose/fructose/sorbose family IIA subunit n=1 Tax=Listeria booriae TaxID=1552123 RepID=A0A7X0YMW7_9LIST|nr:mannose/fructose/sorbose PTS transporter subunit IIA [Listeria booriae]MBC2117304.1 PTS mannose/fructose/sorbose family IIA subunit [Listeria booriae]